MDYGEAKAYIQHLNLFGMKLGLSRIKKLLFLMGNPEKDFRSILVGGTSGKGSTAVMIASVLRESGFRVGLFTKPHLFDFTERVSINGKRITEKGLARLVGETVPFARKVARESESPTFFEFLAALAFRYFREKGVDFAVLEVGLGGRLDATNVVNPEVSVITNVSLEHTDILGKTIQKITMEKAGIVKEGGILVTGSDDTGALRVMRAVCKKRKAKLVRASVPEKASSSARGNAFIFRGLRIRIPLAGRFQLENVGCALAALGSLKARIPRSAVKKGLEKVEWPGRFEIMGRKPTVLLDGAKDPGGMRKVAESLDLIEYGKLYTVLGISNDKSIPKLIAEIAPKTDFFVLTRHQTMDRGADTELLREEVEKHRKPYLVFGTVEEAVEKAIALSGRDDLILVTGSLFTAAEAREMWCGKSGKKAGMGRDFNENLGKTGTR